MSKAKKILSFVLIMLFISHYASTNFFVHTHNYASGTVTHSHPYASGTHTHSAVVLQLIDSLTTLLFVGGIVIFCLVLLFVAKTISPVVETQHAPSLHICGNPLRAPPVSA